jgi:hypothetical protein
MNFKTPNSILDGFLLEIRVWVANCGLATEVSILAFVYDDFLLEIWVWVASCS